MAVYYKFKSAKDYDSISIDGHFISVVNLKERIFESKHLGRGTDFDLVVTNAHTNEEYLDEALLIPKNTSVLVRRVPGRPRMPIVTQPDEPKSEAKAEDDQTSKVNFMATDSSVLKDFGVSDFDDEFGNDLYAIPEMPPGLSSNNLIQDTAAPSKVDEDSKIKAFVESSGFDWQRQATDGFVRGRGFGHDGRGGRGYGRSAGGLERKTPPQGYICHRCKVAGHFIQHCPTNSDPSYDKKKVKPPTGIPKSMLEAAPEGSYALPSGTAAVLKPNEAAFEREIEGLPSTRSVGDLPPELHCPLCKEVMKDAVLTSRCCFKSFCDKCIRDYIISRSICVCGARDVLADDLLPNKTLRDTINRILESGNSSADNTGSAVHVQDMESARYPPPKFPSPTQSAASKGEQRLPPATEETQNTKEIYNGNKPIDAEKPQVQMQNSEKEKINRVPDVSEATHESASVKELPSQGSALHVEEEIQQKVNAADAGKKKKKKKKMPLPMNAPDMQQMQWQGMQPCVDGYMGPSNFNPYWQGMQPPMDGFICPFPGNLHGNIPFMGYGVGPVDPFGNVLPPDPFGPQNIMAPPMFHPPPQRDIAADFGMNMNVRPPLMSREEFEARKAEVRKKREMERRVEREIPRDREYIREVSNSVNAVPVKSKPMPPSVRRSPSVDRYERERDHDCHRGRDRSRDRGSMDRDHDRVRDGHYHRSSHSHSHSLRSERVSPSRSSRDSDVPRSSLKRKSEHHEPDHDNGHRDHVHEREPRHRHFSQSSFLQPSQAPAAPAPEPVPALTASAATASLDNKHKSSVFSRISFPEEELAAKKRKVSAEPKTKSSSSKTAANKDPEASGSGSGRGHHHHHNATASSSSSLANGYHHHSSVKKSMATDMDYESSDDERHFKRKPSRYEPSPPPKEVWVDAEEEGVPRRSRDHKHR